MSTNMFMVTVAVVVVAGFCLLGLVEHLLTPWLDRRQAARRARRQALHEARTSTDFEDPDFR